MAPGTWAQLTVSNQNPILGVGSVSGQMIGFCNTMPWNPQSKVIEIVGADHNYGRLRHVRYDVASNQFVLVADDAGLIPPHGYDHQAVNPYTGDLYSRLLTINTGTIGTKKKVFNGSTFVSIPGVSGQEQIAIGATWWSGSFNGAGSQGAFMIFNSGNSFGNANDGQIVAYNPLTNTWFFNQVAMAPFYGTGFTYSSIIEYSALKNVAVYGGGNAALNKLWRLNSNGSFTTMPNVPSGKTVGVNAGVFVDEPVTGNFLLLSKGELWELNPSGSGTWTQQTGSRTPPSGVGVPDVTWVIASSISDYGVVVFITQPSSGGGTFYLYKHQ